ncbi:cell division control protein 6 homolog isoform X1 [Hippocampus zosterae]|uniref:cell division control protein 6 homolog isoform X1 n=1 Tax=Hippocampus zosterae TaxID=109293 RepID=UPI00223D35BC|nr:cell division control protein 6 homolog isoform X1 [Hippocampus zosterae]
MPSTRSRAHTQPTMPFPRRKSARVAPKPKRTPPESLEPDGEKTRMPEAPSPGRAPSIPARRPAATPLPSSPDASLRLPLSPRKRTGDDNACNVDATLSASPPKRGKAPPPSQRRLAFDENAAGPCCREPSPSSPVAASSPSRRDLAGPSPGKKSSAACRLFAERRGLASAKWALHTAAPERLLAREAERAAIRGFLGRTAARRLPGSLYVSGAPGTGKTACLDWVLRDMKEELAQAQTLVVNCMSLRSSHAIFPLLADKLSASGGGHKALRRHLTGPGPAVLLVLDELDQLDSKGQDVLYTIFEWPHLPESRLCLVGIANALDLTDRVLPRLRAGPGCRPQLLHFPPYSREQLGAIVQDRLAQACAEGALHSAAVQFCARKVSAVSGDARKALDICRRAVEIFESERGKKTERRADEGPIRRRRRFVCWARVRLVPPGVGADVEMPRVIPESAAGVAQVASVLSEVYGDRMASHAGESFPLQQKLLVCCLLMLARAGKSKEVALGKLHEVHSRLCARRQVSGVSQSECLSLCALLESRGVFAIKKAKEARLSKVFLKIDEKAVENALQDRTLVGSILAAGLP